MRCKKGLLPLVSFDLAVLAKKSPFPPKFSAPLSPKITDEAVESVAASANLAPKLFRMFVLIMSDFGF